MKLYGRGGKESISLSVLGINLDCIFERKSECIYCFLVSKFDVMKLWVSSFEVVLRVC